MPLYRGHWASGDCRSGRLVIESLAFRITASQVRGERNVANGRWLSSLPRLEAGDGALHMWLRLQRELAPNLYEVKRRAPIGSATRETVLGAITFLTQHDGYHLGQIALHRRYLGLDAMAYK